MSLKISSEFISSIKSSLSPLFSSALKNIIQVKEPNLFCSNCQSSFPLLTPVAAIAALYSFRLFSSLFFRPLQ
jgi:hypothetical protein